MIEYDYDKFLEGYDELMLEEIEIEEAVTMSKLRQQHEYEVREKLMTGNASDKEVDEFILDYYERNARSSISLYDEVPPTMEDRDHILRIMRSMYFVKTGEHTAGHFVSSVFENDLRAVSYADSVNLRALKLYVWFKHNELSGIRIENEEESLTKE